MPEISAIALVAAVHAVDREIQRLRAIPENVIVPDDDELLVQYETVAEELESVYEEASRTFINLPAYAQLVSDA